MPLTTTSHHPNRQTCLIRISIGDKFDDRDVNVTTSKSRAHFYHQIENNIYTSMNNSEFRYHDHKPIHEWPKEFGESICKCNDISHSMETERIIQSTHIIIISNQSIDIKTAFETQEQNRQKNKYNGHGILLYVLVY